MPEVQRCEYINANGDCAQQQPAEWVMHRDGSPCPGCSVAPMLSQFFCDSCLATRFRGARHVRCNTCRREVRLFENILKVERL